MTPPKIRLYLVAVKFWSSYFQCDSSLSFYLRFSVEFWKSWKATDLQYVTRSDNSLASLVVFFGFLFGSCRQKQFWNQFIVLLANSDWNSLIKIARMKSIFRTWRQNLRECFRLQGLRAVPQHQLWNATSPRDVIPTRQLSESFRVFVLSFDREK